MEYNKYIDHTLLKPEATEEDIVKICEEAKKYSFASVCVNPTWVKVAFESLADSPVKVCTVIGFPLGATTTATKKFETMDAIQNGATEIDMVLNIGALHGKDYDTVKNDILAVTEVAKGKAIVKVIIETALLSESEKRVACELAVAGGAHFVKTSTGFSTRGATVEDLKLMRGVVGPEVGVKASGGIRSLEDMKEMITAGATRIGASSGVEIVKGMKGKESY